MHKSVPVCVLSAGEEITRVNVVPSQETCFGGEVRAGLCEVGRLRAPWSGNHKLGLGSPELCRLGPISRECSGNRKAGGGGWEEMPRASGPCFLCSPHRSSVVHTTHFPAMRSLLLANTFCLLAVAVALAAEVKKPEAAAAPGTAEKLSPKAATLAERSAGLAFSLYQAMAKDQAVENILLSPLVVASSLGLVSLGGKATTASQAKAVLSAEQLRDEEVHTGLGELLRSLSNSTARNVTWKLGSRLYGPSSVSFAEDFVRSSKQHYNCEHSKINFRDKRSALQSINEWASQTTDGKLPEVTKEVERTDGALLVNAMFFKRESRGAGQGERNGAGPPVFRACLPVLEPS